MSVLIELKKSNFRVWVCVIVTPKSSSTLQDIIFVITEYQAYPNVKEKVFFEIPMLLLICLCVTFKAFIAIGKKYMVHRIKCLQKTADKHNHPQKSTTKGPGSVKIKEQKKLIVMVV